MDFHIHNIILLLNQHLTLWIVFPFVVVLGVYLSVKLKCIQITKLGLSAQKLVEKSDDNPGDITPFQAVSAVLAGNLGTGNISGMAVAIASGGPGALVWMWVMALLGSVIQYASCLLGAKYRIQDDKSRYLGGPMYYLAHGTGSKLLASLFAVFTIFGAFTVGNLVQIHSIILPIEELGLSPLVMAILIALFVGLVIVGGIERFAHIAASIVPVKAAVYLGTACVILVYNFDKIPEAFALMINSALSFSSLGGGTLGFLTVKAIATGFERGLFATDAGTGIVPILQASTKSTNPVITGLITLVAPIAVMLVCTATGLVLLTTGAWTSGLESTNMVTHAFSIGLGSSFGKYIVIISLLMFAYTTLLAWSCCLERAGYFLWGDKSVRILQYCFIACIPLGTLLHVEMVWALADVCISLMLIVNLVGIIKLSHEVVQDSQQYFLSQAQEFVPCESSV